MRRFFVSPENPSIITGPDAHHIRNVLRLKTGDQVELLDGTGNLYTAKISKFEKDVISCDILSTRQSDSEPKVKVTLAQALPKSTKMDLIVEKSVELGVGSIIPMISERTVAKGAKLERWRKIAKSAAEQSGRAIIPEIKPVISFAEILKLRGQFDLSIIPWELEKEKSLKLLLQNPPTPYSLTPSILITIGPEGGFSQNEIELAKEAGFISVSLGKRILRTETAGLTVIAVINYEFE